VLHETWCSCCCYWGFKSYGMVSHPTGKEMPSFWRIVVPSSSEFGYLTALPFIEMSLFTSKHSAQENLYLQWCSVHSFTRTQQSMLTLLTSPTTADIRNIFTDTLLYVILEGHFDITTLLNTEVIKLNFL
jgi:hypothetical protein